MRQENRNFEFCKKLSINYLLYIPKGYDSSKKYPMILFLHGISRRGNDIEILKGQGIPEYIENGNDLPFIVLSPQCPDGAFWEFILEDLSDLIDDVSKKYSVDISRLYLTGLSMGGIGTWSMAIKYPHKFAAIAPICSKHDNVKDVEKIKHMPIWVFHGAKDDVIPIEKSQELVDELKRIEGNVRFTVYPDLNHDSWTTTYNNFKLYEWFLENHLEEI